MHNKKLLIFIILGIVIIAGAIVYSQKNRPTETDDRVILFYRDGCPHCANVDEFVKANNVGQKYPFEHINVEEATNASLFLKKIKACKIPSALAGVPLLWDRSRCFLGDPDIINFFKEKI